MVHQPDPNDRPVIVSNPHGIPGWDEVVKNYGKPIQGGRYKVVFKHWSRGIELDNFARYVGDDEEEDTSWRFFDGSEPGYDWYPVYWRLIRGPDDD